MPSTNLKLPVFYGTYADLTKLDLSFVNMKIILLKGIAFRRFLREILADEFFDHSFGFIMAESKEGRLYENEDIKQYVIVPVDAKNPFLEDHWHHFHQLMLSIYPSDFTLVKEIHLRLSDGKYQAGHKTYYDFRSTGKEHFDNFMFIDKAEYKFVRNYLTTYFETSFNLNYVKYMLSTYANSFYDTNKIYKFLSLIICLEVVVEGNEQLTYKLKRNVALLCGVDVRSSKKIYSNVDQLYALRSAIVHGNIKPTYKNFNEYYDYLKTLVARLIRELIVHNLPTVQELNEILTTLGYGQNEFISANYEPLKHPIMDNITLSYKGIEKYKKS